MLENTSIYGSFPSPTEFWLQNILFYLEFSILGIGSNLFLFTVIYTDRETLWKYPFYVLITAFSSAKATVCLATTLFGIYQIVGYRFPVLLFVTRTGCISLFAPIVTVELFVSIIMLLLTVDRVMAVIFPLTYHQMVSGKIVFLCIIVLFLVTIPVEAFGVVIEKSKSDDLLRCINPMQYSVTVYYSVIFICEIVNGFIGVVFYISILVRMEILSNDQ